MAGGPRNSATKTRGRPFAPGNPGKPKGARNRVTVAAEELLSGEAEALTRKAVDLALGGDTTALRLCLDRAVPLRKGRPVRFGLTVDAAGDLPQALADVLVAISRGELTAEEGQALAAIVESRRRSLESEQFERRLAELEAKASR